MDDDLEPLLVEVRASTQGFAQDIAGLRTTLDSTLLDGFDRAGSVLERGLVGAIRRGSLGFDDLKRIALSTMSEIAAQAARNLFSSLPGGGIGGLLNLGGLVGSVLGLPGRATGGPVSPGRGYLVGERGPELFVPTSSGRVENFERGASRDVRVSIGITAPRGANGPESLQRFQADRSPAPCDAPCPNPDTSKEHHDGILARQQARGAGKRLDPAFRSTVLDALTERRFASASSTGKAARHSRSTMDRLGRSWNRTERSVPNSFREKRNCSATRFLAPARPAGRNSAHRDATCPRSISPSRAPWTL